MSSRILDSQGKDSFDVRTDFAINSLLHSQGLLSVNEASQQLHRDLDYVLNVSETGSVKKCWPSGGP